MTSRTLFVAMLATVAASTSAPAAERCAEKKFPPNAKVRSGELDDLFGKVAASEKPVRLMVIAPPANASTSRFLAGIDREAKRLGVATEAAQPSTNLASGPDAVLLLAGMADTKAIVAEARSKGIPTLGVGAKVDGVRLSVAPDQAAFGAMAAEYLHELYPLGTSVAQLAVAGKSVEATERSSGFVAGTKDYPNITLAGTFPADGSREGGGKATVALMSAHPEVKGIYAGNDEMALGAIEALKNLKLFEVAVVGTEGTLAGRDALAHRTIKGTVANFPEKEGALAVQTALRLIACQQLPPWVVSPQVTMTPKSIEDFASQTQ